jgi:putative N6-adenine-specific DNA methylase
LWIEARREARDLIRPNFETPLVGSDIDERALGMARKHAKDAGVAADTTFEQRAFREIAPRRKYGCLICNPPYGERSGDVTQAEELARETAAVFRRLETWSFYVLTALPHFEELCGRKADRRRKLYNGRIECTYYQFYGPRPPWQQPPPRKWKEDDGKPEGSEPTSAET